MIYLESDSKFISLVLSIITKSSMVTDSYEESSVLCSYQWQLYWSRVVSLYILMYARDKSASSPEYSICTPKLQTSSWLSTHWLGAESESVDGQVHYLPHVLRWRVLLIKPTRVTTSFK